MIHERVFYGRVSTKADAQDSSILHQEQYFKERGITKGYIEKSSGTSITKRPVFQEMLKECGLDTKKVKSGTKYKTIVVESNRPSKIKYIHCKSISRFSRNTAEFLDIVRLLKNKGTYVVFDDIKESTESEGFKLILPILSSMAENESVEKSRSIKIGASITAKNGVRRSWSAYGYEYLNDTKSLKKIPHEAEVVKLIFDMRMEKKGGRVIAKYLNEQGYRTREGKEWLAGTINRMVKNPIYAGYTTRNRWDTNKLFGANNHRLKSEDEWIMIENNKVEAIVSKEVFERSQDIRREQTNKGSKVGIYKGTSEFAQKIICEKCGEKYTRNSDRKVLKDGTVYERVFYNCSTKKKYGKVKCNSRNVSLEELDKIIDFYITDGNYKTMANRFYKNVFIPRAEIIKNKLKLSINVDTTAEITEVQNLITSKRNRVSRLIDLYLDKEIDKTILDEKKFTIEKEIVDLENRMKILQQSNDDILHKIDIVDDLTEQFNSIVKEIPIEISKKDFIENYLVGIVVKKDGVLMPVTNAHQMVVILNKTTESLTMKNLK